MMLHLLLLLISCIIQLLRSFILGDNWPLHRHRAQRSRAAAKVRYSCSSSYYYYHSILSHYTSRPFYTRRSGCLSTIRRASRVTRHAVNLHPPPLSSLSHLCNSRITHSLYTSLCSYALRPGCLCTVRARQWRDPTRHSLTRHPFSVFLVIIVSSVFVCVCVRLCMCDLVYVVCCVRDMFLLLHTRLSSCALRPGCLSTVRRVSGATRHAVNLPAPSLSLSLSCDYHILCVGVCVCVCSSVSV